jgi:hypothetical protein
MSRYLLFIGAALALAACDSAPQVLPCEASKVRFEAALWGFCVSALLLALVKFPDFDDLGLGRITLAVERIAGRRRSQVIE